MKPTFDDVRDQIEGWGSHLPGGVLAERSLGWAELMAVGDAGRAELLYVAGEALIEDEPEEALAHFAAATDDGGPTTIDARSGSLHALLRLGRDDEADTLLRCLRKAPVESHHTAGLHSSVGEVLETTDRLKEAQRWFTIGLREFDPEVDEPDLEQDLCLSGRYRVRRALGLPSDGFDRWLEDDAPEAAEDIRNRSR